MQASLLVLLILERGKMSTLKIFIDETGDYSYKSKTSYLGGFAVLESKCNHLINSFKEKTDEIYKQFMPDDLKAKKLTSHYFWHSKELFMIAKYKKAEAIIDLIKNHKVNEAENFKLLPENIATEILNAYENIFLKQEIIFFKGIGVPNIYGGGQSDYLYQLIGTLFGLCIELKKQNYKHLEFCIARRAQVVFNANKLGSELFDTLYQDYIIQIKSHLDNNFSDLKIEIEFKYADHTAELKCADLFLGFSKNKLGKVFNCLEIDSTAYLQTILPTVFDQFETSLAIYSAIDEMPYDCLKLFELLKNAEFKKHALKINTLLRKLSEGKVQFLDTELFPIIESFYNQNKYNEGGKKPKILAENIIALTPNGAKFTKCTKLAYKILFELKVHSGLYADENTWQNYLQFLKVNQKELFQTDIDYFCEILNSNLVKTQLLFNELDFEQAKRIIEPDKKCWLECVEKINKFLNVNSQLPNNAGQDAYYARALGTEGQAHIFIGDLKNDPEEMSFGYELLLEDIELLALDSPYYIPGINYIITYLIQNKKFNESHKWFEKLIKNALNQSSIGKLNNTGSELFPNGLVTFQKYNYLNQLRYIGLQIISGQNLVLQQGAIRTQINTILDSADCSFYPTFMILKWLAFLYDKKDSDLNKKLMDWACKAEFSSPLLTLMACPLLYQIEKDICIRLLKKVQKENKIIGFISFFEARKTILEKILKKTATNEEAILLMPFYYS